MNPVGPITWKGWLLVALIRNLYRFLDLLGYRHGPYPEVNQHEDPGSMPNRWHEFRSGVYLGSKYYYQPFILDEQGSGIREALLTHHTPDPLPEGFQVEQRISLIVCQHLWDEIGDEFFGADLVVAMLHGGGAYQAFPGYLHSPSGIDTGLC